MIIRSARHRGLRQLLERDDPRFLSHDLTDRVRKILAALILARSMADFVGSAPPGWRVHRLAGNRLDQWSVSVSRNWRLTFEVEGGYIDRIDLEDYH